EENEQQLPVNLNKLVVQVADLTRPRWRDIPQERGIMIRMQTDLDANLPDVLGNESEIREALTNLILNAVDAMPEGGTMSIRTCSSTFDLTNLKVPAHVVLEVCDDGIGMDEETKKRC